MCPFRGGHPTLSRGSGMSNRMTTPSRVTWAAICVCLGWASTALAQTLPAGTTLPIDPSMLPAGVDLSALTGTILPDGTTSIPGIGTITGTTTTGSTSSGSTGSGTKTPATTGTGSTGTGTIGTGTTG